MRECAILVKGREEKGTENDDGRKEERKGHAIWASPMLRLLAARCFLAPVLAMHMLRLVIRSAKGKRRLPPPIYSLLHAYNLWIWRAEDLAKQKLKRMGKSMSDYSFKGGLLLKKLKIDQIRKCDFEY